MKSRLPGDEELRRLYVDKRLTVKAIAELFDVSRQRIHQRLKVGNIKRSKKSIDRAKLEKLYIEARLPARQIGKKLGLSTSFIRSELIRHKITLHSLKRFSFDRDSLYELYVTNGLLMREIAKKLGCSESTVGHELIRHGIKERHPTAARRPPRFTREHLITLYKDKRLKPGQIAENAGCDQATVRYWLNKYGIATKPGRFLLCTEEAIRRYYIDEVKTVKEIATILEVCTSAVYYALERYGIPLRPRGE